jgi:hypothetical protein
MRCPAAYYLSECEALRFGRVGEHRAHRCHAKTGEASRVRGGLGNGARKIRSDAHERVAHCARSSQASNGWDPTVANGWCKRLVKELVKPAKPLALLATGRQAGQTRWPSKHSGIEPTTQRVEGCGATNQANNSSCVPCKRWAHAGQLAYRGVNK